MGEATPHAPELLELLNSRNGFYAFGHALHVFPSGSTDLSWGLVDWNMPGLWKHEYQSFIDPGLCFAEDIFGNQFSIKGGRIHNFDIETGRLTEMAQPVTTWADLILSDHQFWTGSSLAKRWEKQIGRLPLHKRLRPSIPFCCGGSYDIENLRAVDSSDHMAASGSIARQLQNIPDGGQVRFVIGPEPESKA